MQFESSPRCIPRFLMQLARRPVLQVIIPHINVFRFLGVMFIYIVLLILFICCSTDFFNMLFLRLAWFHAFQVQKKMEDLNLQMYLVPPVDNISLAEFQELALNRLKVLKAVEQVKDRFPRTNEALNDALSKELLKLMPIACGCCPFEELEKERRRDVISHFILRLAFCQTPEQTKWFIQQEVDLFRFRFQIVGILQVSKNCDAITKFLECNNFDAQLIADSEKQLLKEDLSNGCCIPLNKALSTNFWKVPFVDALDLVRKRRVLLISGFAYVSEDDLQVIMCTRFRLNIAAAMARACRNIVFLEEDDRLMPFLKKLSSRSYVGKNYVGKDTSRITPNMVDCLAASSFPLCMRTIHNRLRADHHLRHGARMQYGLFLKAIGMTLEDALCFWRTEFTKKMDSDKFEKQYAYNIRHNYGKEGKHADYAAYPCTKIILDITPSSGDCHGCPYRHCDSQLLIQKLENLGFTKSQSDSIVSLAKSARYDKACTRYFECAHKMTENSMSTVITHPNQYYELSRQVHEGKRNKEEEPKHEIILNISQPNSTEDDIEDLMKFANS
ncbi:unnamed protein product [Thelazia callipaeda]|uniref:DNA primase large subunit n=1 Tax=Thelazia callipaeda TaxID=103827 RepID=A0A0N5D3D7_THECL|nr:unnamed protein product [Thelazia callipaeda]